MISSEDKLKAIEELDSVGIGQRTPAALSRLREVFLLVFGESVDSNCEGCIRKAYGKLQLITLNKLNNMENSKFKLKEGCLLPFGEFGSGEFLTKDNLTDAAAYQALSANPRLIYFFEEYPKDEEGNLLPAQEEEPVKAPEGDLTDLNNLKVVKNEELPAVDPATVVETDLNGLNKEDVPEGPSDIVTDTVLTDTDGVVVEPKEVKVPDLSNITKDELLLQYAEKFGVQHENPSKVKKSELWTLINA